MSAEILRKAAALMRERAEAATATGAWDWRANDGSTWWAETTRSGRYIQSWHPAVALAVADWLEAKAEQDDKGTCDDPRGCCNLCEHDYGHVAALTVARAYLGSES